MDKGEAVAPNGARHWLSSQNFRVGTLQTARDDPIPTAEQNLTLLMICVKAFLQKSCAKYWILQIPKRRCH